MSFEKTQSGRRRCHLERKATWLGAVVLVNSDLADTLGIVGLPSILFRPSLLGALRVFLRLLPEPCRPAAGNPGAPPSTRRSAALGEATEAHPGGSTPVGRALRRVEPLAVQSLPRPSLHRHRLAPEGLSSLLDVEGSVGKTGKARRAAGDPRFDSDLEPGESALGRSAHPQRVTEAGH